MEFFFELHFVGVTEAVGSYPSDLLREMMEDVENTGSKKIVNINLNLPIHLGVADLLSSREFIEGFQNKMQDGFDDVEFHIFLVLVQLEDLLVVDCGFLG